MTQEQVGNPITGLIVMSVDRRFLSRSYRWVRHRNSQKKLYPGNRRAWVHSLSTILNGGPWVEEAAKVLPACFDPVIGYTALGGQEVMYQDFFKHRRMENSDIGIHD